MWWAQHIQLPLPPACWGRGFSAQAEVAGTCWPRVVTLALILGCVYLGGWAISRNYGLHRLCAADHPHGRGIGTADGRYLEIPPGF